MRDVILSTSSENIDYVTSDVGVEDAKLIDLEVVCHGQLYICGEERFGGEYVIKVTAT